ncbi:hypothetical protein Moror_11495 [Moniliophthora roreri MCA 2997]|uniref:DUF4939 domain-containing protein n=1 Tax=Moniliophthora roreri (strain MCA 2997) TaxID=1381753 RepID=V2WU15_MONRO|nr:hypothetical protein Moror_11495 [Moniliophthora roreri MCA 2997]
MTDQETTNIDATIVDVLTVEGHNTDDHKGYKVALPEPFDGEREETKRFMAEVAIYLSLNRKNFNTDRKKILFVLSFLKGEWARKWKLGKIQEYLYTDEEKLLMWKDFWIEFRQIFEEADLAEDARMKMDKLKMTRRASNYVQRFKLLAADVGYNDTALIRAFARGLN